MVQTRISFKIHVPILMCLLALVPGALAQMTTSTLTGTVADPSGAAIPGARISVQNLGTNNVRTVEANSSGAYTAGDLLPGTYAVTAEKSGFRKSIQTGIVLTVGQVATLSISLQLGDVKESVTIIANAELINTTTAEISQVINQDSIADLPLNGRDPSSLVLLSAGTVNALNTAGGYSDAGTGFATSTSVSSGGGHQGTTYYLLDGAPNMDTYDGISAPFPNSDATQEFRVITNNFDARYGNSSAAVVTIQTKNGANAFHGGAFEFIRNNDLNASNYFSHNVDSLKRNQFGGYVGGPIIKNKLFFFVNYQGTTESTAVGTNPAEAPTQAMLNGDFSAVPFTLTGGFATKNGMANQIDPALFSQASVTIAKTALPLGQDAATGLLNYVGPPQKDNYKEGTARFDYTINNNQSLYLRSFTDYFNAVGGAVKGNLLAVVEGNPAEYYNNVLGHTWIINPTTVNNAAAFWTEMSAVNAGQALDTSGDPVCLSRYINVSEKAGHCYLMGFTVASAFSSGWNEPTEENRTTFGFSDALTKTIGNHAITVGGNLYKQFAEESTDYPATPYVDFANTYTGFGLADFLLGDVFSYTQGAGEISSVKGWQLGLFAQDQWRVKSNLSLTAGLRWDPNIPPASQGARGSAFHPGQQSTQFPNAPVGMVFPGDAGVDDALMPTTYGYFEPRVGFSWQPKFLPRTAVRGGFGLFTSPLPYSSYNHLADIAPFSPTFALNANPGAGYNIPFDDPWSTFTGTGGKNPFPPFASIGYKPPTNSLITTPVTIGAVFSNNFKLAMTQSWNLTIDHELSNTVALHLAYVASEAYHLSTIRDLNPGIYANQGARSTYSLFGQVLSDESSGTSNYQSLQAGVEKRLSHGFQIQSNFTWDKLLDIDAKGNIANEAGGIPNPFDLRWNRGISALDFPIIWVTNFVYKSPSLRGWNPFMKNVLGEWELSAINTAQSGLPFGIEGGANGNNNSLSQQSGDRADVVPGVSWNAKHGSKQQWLTQYVNPAAFTANALGTFGNSGKNILRAPTINTADASLAKNWKFYERYGLQFRWEAFNVFNHTSYSTPNNNPTTSNFGQITSIGPIPPRVMQGALKFTF